MGGAHFDIVWAGTHGNSACAHRRLVFFWQRLVRAPFTYGCVASDNEAGQVCDPHQLLT